ncbi:MAG: MFS transporter [Verrucomicrobiota bacterium]|nr:MFS transporter [Verrucomicrobiota bacterium]
MNLATIQRSIPVPAKGCLRPLTDLLVVIKGLPRAIWVLYIGTFLNKFGTFVVPFLALYMTRQGYSLAQAGTAIGAYGAGHLLASIIGGHLADSIGRRNTIVLSMFSTAIAMVLLSYAPSFWMIVLLSGCAGLTGELYRPASMALIADLTPPGHRTAASAAYRVALNAGWAFGPATAGFLAESSFQWLFFGDAFTSFLFGIVALKLLPHGLRGQTKQVKWSAAFKAMRLDRQFTRLCFANLLIALVFFQMASSYGLHVTQAGFSSSTYGMLISVNGLLVVVFEILIVTYAQRFPAKYMIFLGYCLIGLGFGLNAFSFTIPMLVLSMCIFTLGEMISMPVGAGFISELAPPAMRGRYMGTLGFTWATAMMFGPGLGMQLFLAGPTLLWLTCASLGIGAGLVVLQGLSSPNARTVSVAE